MSRKAPNIANIRIGSNIRYARVSAGVSQSWLAEKIGTSYQSIQRYEDGTNGVSIIVMRKIAAALGVSAAYLYGETDTKLPFIHKDTAAIIAASNKLSPDRRSLLRSIAVAMEQHDSKSANSSQDDVA